MIVDVGLQEFEFWKGKIQEKWNQGAHDCPPTPTDQPCFIWQNEDIICMYVCALLVLNILIIYINKYYKLYTYIINKS